MNEVIRIFFRLITIISKNKIKEEKRCTMPKLEVEFIIRSVDIDSRMPLLCGMPKSYKGKVNPRPRR